MDFPSGAITEAAKAFVANESATPAPTPAPAAPTPSAPSAPAAELAPAATPSPETPAVPKVDTPAAPAATPEPIEINDTAHYRVKTVVNGVEQVETQTGAEVRARQMNARKFTQEMQALRNLERTFSQERQQLVTQATEARAILTDRARLAAHIQQQFPGTTLADAQAAAAQIQAQPGYQPQQQAQPAPQAVPRQHAVDPDGLASIGDIQSRVAATEADLGRKLEGFERTLAERLAAAEAAQEQVVLRTIGQLARANEVASYDQKVSSSISDLKKEMPALEHIPGVDDLLRWRVSQAQPKSAEEMFFLLDREARAIHEGLSSVFNAQHQAAAAAKAAMVASGAEPPAGTPPTFQRQISHRGKDGKFDWNALTTDARNRMNSL